MKPKGFDYDNIRVSTNNLELSNIDDIVTKCRGKKIAVFLGAGFSKAWDAKYPLSNDIFSISESDAVKERKNYKFFDLFDSLSLKWASDTANINEKVSVFKLFKYTMDIYKRYPSLLPSHLDKYTLNEFEDEIKKYIKTKFYKKVGKAEAKLILPKKIAKNKSDIISLFKLLSKISRLGVITTNYDIVIDKILHEITAEQCLLRGHIVKMNGSIKCPNPNALSLFKINGGFEVVEYKDNFKIDYDSVSNNLISPNIILPSNEQIYDDKYFKTVFVKSSNFLRNAEVMLFIGYSFPKEDHIIRFLLKSFIDSDDADKETIIIGRNKKSAENMHSSACDVFKELNDKSGLFYFGGAFEELCSQSKKLA